MIELVKKLAEIQEKINVPKGRWNDFGKYFSRSCDDILKASRPLLNGLVLTLSDEMILIGERYYNKATASITDGKNTISTTAFAREAKDKKKFDEAQITGLASSYSRKYALGGLFALDDIKDADTLDNSNNENKINVKDYIVPIGKFKDVKLSDIITEDLIQYCTFMTKDGKKVDGPMKEFIDNAREYLKGK